MNIIHFRIMKIQEFARDNQFSRKQYFFNNTFIKEISSSSCEKDSSLVWSRMLGLWIAKNKSVYNRCFQDYIHVDFLPFDSNSLALMY